MTLRGAIHWLSARPHLGGSIAIIGAQAAVDDVPTANVKPPEFEIEKGATLRVLRPAKFVDPDEVYWKPTPRSSPTRPASTCASISSAGRICDRRSPSSPTPAPAPISWRLRRRSAHLLREAGRLTDLADYLGAKYGGWYDLALLYGRKWETNEWIAMPMGGGSGATVYRMSWLKEAGYDSVPNDHQGFLECAGSCKRSAIRSASRSATRSATPTASPTGCCGRTVPRRGRERQGHAGFEGDDRRAEIRHGTAADDDSGYAVLERPGNNKAYAAGEISVTFNGVSIYYVLLKSSDPELQEIAADTNHQETPFGLSKRSAAVAAVVNAMVFKHTKYPNAAKEYLRFMMEAEQYGPWLANCLGYWCHPLKAYSKMEFWTAIRSCAVCRGIGYAVLRRLQGPDHRGVGGSDRQLHAGGHVRLRRHRQRHAGSGGEAGGESGRALL